MIQIRKFLFLIPLFLFLFSPYLVSATTITDRYSFSDNYTYNLLNGTYNYQSDTDYYAGGGFDLPSFLNSFTFLPYDSTVRTVNMGIQWNNKNWCNGGQIKFSGYLVPQQIETSRHMFDNVSSWSLRLEVPTTGYSSTCTINSVPYGGENVATLKFTCYAPESTFTSRSFKFLLAPITSSYYSRQAMWGIENRTFSYSCDVSTADLISVQNANQQQTNQKLDDVNNSLNDDTGVSNSDVSSKTNEWANLNASTGPVSGMVLMPITLLNAYVNGFGNSSTCSPYNLGNLYGTDLILPCIDISNYVGNTLWGVIDVLFSGLMIYAMGKRFVRMFNDFTNLKDNQIDDLYGGGN